MCPNCPSFKETVMDATGRNETFVSNIGPPGNPRGYTSIASKTKSMCAEIQYIAAWDESMYVCMYVPRYSICIVNYGI